MKPPSIRTVRCAIYTRVSTEYGLDQEFNSLDAQYDAASAYIKSQAHAGWTLVRSRYDAQHLPRHLLFAIIAYRIQADRFGDLDHETRQLLGRTSAPESGTAMSARLLSFDQKRTELTPGTVLVREWDRRSQRVMVMSDGLAWNGQSYDSLSKVAFAITGTNWNGPRFFGLRNKEDRSAMETRP